MPWDIAPTPIPGYTASPEWLPDGVIAFSVIKEPHTELATGGSVLDLVHTDGTGLVELANGPDSWNDCPAWSPDGTRIIYASGPWYGPNYSL